MKAILTLFFVLFLSYGLSAQKQTTHAKMESNQMDTFLDSGSDDTLPGRKNKKVASKEIARLYRFKNARIQKELAFKTKKQHFTV